MASTDPTVVDVFVTKQANKDVAAVGDFVQYKVVVQNSDAQHDGKFGITASYTIGGLVLAIVIAWEADWGRKWRHVPVRDAVVVPQPFTDAQY